jgi:hypothetical protein
MPQLSVSLSPTDEIQCRDIARRRGISMAEAMRVALRQLAGSAAALVEAPEAVVDQLERRNGSGKRITTVYLSPPLASAVRKLACEKNSSASHLVRDILRNELRRLGRLPNNSRGSIAAMATTDAPPQA